MATRTFALCWLVAVSWLSCAPPRPFAPPFLLGSATSGFQVEMGCPTLPASVCEDVRSDWYRFVTADERAALWPSVRGDPPSAGPGHYELFSQDFERAASELSHSAVRLGLEWSRIFPESTEGLAGYESLRAHANPAALAHYHAVFDDLKARGLVPLVTLNHYTLPVWIHEPVECRKDLKRCARRGWLDRGRTVGEIAKYAGFVAQEFGGKVDLWATLNEPLATVLTSYLLEMGGRLSPPGLTLRFDEAKLALEAQVEAHARMYDAVHEADRRDADGDGSSAEVGLVANLTATAPRRPESRLDQRGAEDVFYLINTVLLEATVRGRLDARLDRAPVSRPDLEGRMDFLGLNYYGRIVVQGLETPAFPALSSATRFDPFSLEHDTVHPRGLEEMLLLVKSYGLPCYVTENGTTDPGDDGSSGQYLIEHLQVLADTMAQGADVRGYFYWSLLDNYEWSQGMRERYGLYAVDPNDPLKTRTARRSVAMFARVAREGRLPSDLVAAHPVRE